MDALNSLNPENMSGMGKMVNCHPFELKLASNWPPDQWQDLNVLVAVSGGADSVGLLRGLAALRAGRIDGLHVAHLHHGLRAREATSDQLFVEKLCDSLDIRCHTGQANTQKLAWERGDGIEQAARELRYSFFQSTAERIGARYVVTAHTADDQAETILHHIIRGTGISGLCGIPRIRRLGSAVSLIRPLLATSHDEIAAYLARLGQTYRTDSSNRDLKYTRNRIRHELLPSLVRDYNVHVRQALTRIGELAGDVQRVVDRQLDTLWERTVTVTAANSVSVDPRGFAEIDAYLVRELFIRVWREKNWPRQSMGYRQWKILAEIATTGDNVGQSVTLPGNISVKRNQNELILMALRGTDS